MSNKLKAKKKTRFPVRTSNQAAQAFGRAMQNCYRQVKDIEQQAYEDAFTVGEDWSNTINTVTTMMALRRLYGFSTKRLLDVIRTANKYVKMANEALLNGMPIDIITIYIKQILDDLGEITGDCVTEDIINEIFSKFCLGK